MFEKFEKGREKTGGRIKGSRNRLSHALVEALCKEFEEYGAEAIKLARIERPSEFLKIIASIIPKEFEITDSRLKDLNDDELDYLIELTKRRLGADLAASIGSTGGREEQTIN